MTEQEATSPQLLVLGDSIGTQQVPLHCPVSADSMNGRVSTLAEAGWIWLVRIYLNIATAMFEW